MADTTIEVTERGIEGLAKQLDGAGDSLTDEQRATLIAIFDLAAEALDARWKQSDDEVEGFSTSDGGPLLARLSYPPQTQLSLSAGLQKAFIGGPGGRNLGQLVGVVTPSM